MLVVSILTSCAAPNDFIDGVSEASETAEQGVLSSAAGGEITLLLRPLDENRIDIVGVSADCLADEEECEIHTISHLPSTMPQILKIYWLRDGIHALFWDSDSGNIYKLDRFTGELQLFKSAVWKTQNDFFFSPDGGAVLYDRQKNEFENEIVLMDVDSGNAQTLTINVAGMKRIAEWLDNDRFLFWAESYSGQKGDLENIQVYTFAVSTQKLQALDLGMSWLTATPPYYSPDGGTFIVTTGNTLSFFDKENQETRSVEISSEKYLWSPDSACLALYTQQKNVVLFTQSGNQEKTIFALPSNTVLSDWHWLPGVEELLMVVSNVDSGATRLFEYSMQNDWLVTVDWPILAQENVVSLSYRPAAK